MKVAASETAPENPLAGTGNASHTIAAARRASTPARISTGGPPAVKLQSAAASTPNPERVMGTTIGRTRATSRDTSRCRPPAPAPLSADSARWSFKARLRGEERVQPAETASNRGDRPEHENEHVHPPEFPVN